MFKYEIKNLKNGSEYGARFEKESDGDLWVADQIDKNSWGKKAREIIIHADNVAESTIEDDYVSVEDISVDDIPMRKYSYACDYIINKVDLTTDYDYLLDVCHAKREREYAKIGDQLDALMKSVALGDNSQLEAIAQACMAVKAKYPLPTK